MPGAPQAGDNSSMAQAHITSSVTRLGRKLPPRQPSHTSTQPQAVTAAIAATIERDVKQAPRAITVVRVMPRYVPTAATPSRSTRRPLGVRFAAVRGGCLRPKTDANTAHIRVHRAPSRMPDDRALYDRPAPQWDDHRWSYRIRRTLPGTDCIAPPRPAVAVRRKRTPS